ncbi:cation:dicarboxylate symporter family transporter [Bacillus sp. LLTC93]|uniref:cation:dicarboxylate symporter family transporter n=1 Tax=Bacillus sp. LLTC93 TaxID=2108274 RepID=UPI0011579EFE|nr:cation:dicarboxylase symporter family transporter [Bacillus sp. LLTC93]
MFLTSTFIGLPLEGIALLMTADSIMDMARTTTNIIGNALATVAERGTTID